MQKPTTGKIYFNGKKLDEFSYRESALKLAVVAQHNFYNFDFSVLDVVLMGRSPHKKMMERDNAEDYKIARDALRVVGLEEFGERNFFHSFRRRTAARYTCQSAHAADGMPCP